METRSTQWYRNTNKNDWTQPVYHSYDNFQHSSKCEYFFYYYSEAQSGRIDWLVC